MDFPEVKRFGLPAFDAGDGKLAWESEGFKKGIPHVISIDKNPIVCSGKALYTTYIETGDEPYEDPESKGDVGQANMV